MAIQVKFFASLRERVGQSDARLDANEVNTAQDVWQQIVGDAEPDKNILIAVNMEYVDATHPVNDGDEVAFFPPVTGG